MQGPTSGLLGAKPRMLHGPRWESLSVLRFPRSDDPRGKNQPAEFKKRRHRNMAVLKTNAIGLGLDATPGMLGKDGCPRRPGDPMVNSILANEHPQPQWTGTFRVHSRPHAVLHSDYQMLAERVRRRKDDLARIRSL